MKTTENVLLCTNCDTLIEFRESDLQEHLSVPERFIPALDIMKEEFHFRPELIYILECPKCNLRRRLYRQPKREINFSDFGNLLIYLSGDRTKDRLIANTLFHLSDDEFNDPYIQEVLNALSSERMARIQKWLDELYANYERPTRTKTSITLPAIK